MKQTCLYIVLFLFALALAGCGEEAAVQSSARADEKAAPEQSAPTVPPAPAADAPAPAQSPAPEAASPAAPGGSASGEQASGPPAADSLAGRHFVLKSVDGVDFSGKERVPEMAFSAELRLSGGICNRFMGQGELSDGTLTVKQMASTKMLCTDEDLNRLEALFAQMLTAGAEINLEGGTLALRRDGHELLFEAR